ncbi:MAG: hypothetical protein ABI415_04785 [Flavitalea sp.]
MMMFKILTLALLLSIYSCTPAKLATVSSEDAQFKNSSSYIFENSMVKITYRFWAANGIMDFDIYNKTSDPIYFDWKNSSFIPNDQMVSYWQDVTNTVGSTSTATAWLYGGAITSTKGASKSIRQERIGVIPPRALITKKDFRLVKQYKDMPKQGLFTKENSFLNFRNYLMFSTNEKFDGKTTVIDNYFYISEIKNIKFGKREKYRAQNKFFVKNK